MFLLKILVISVICIIPFIFVWLFFIIDEKIISPLLATKLKEGDIIFIKFDPEPYTIIKVNHFKNTYIAKNKKGSYVGIGVDSIEAKLVYLSH